MEYEIEDDDALFDPSNNPSLDHAERKSAGTHPPSRPDEDRRSIRLLSGERIPAEERAA